MRLLARREHSAAELRRKLEWRGVEAAEAGRAVDELAEAGWQSDERYAESMVRQRIAQGCGPLRIESELEQAGLGAALIRAAVDAADCDWTELARQAHARRFDAPQDARDWQKQYHFLRGRGFLPEQIRAVLKHAPFED